MTESIAPVPVEAAAARAYHALEGMIVTLELPPASVTTEGALIERLGFGRTPVREAIQRLAWEGLIEVRPRAGLAIAPLHATDWLRVVDARRGLEIVLAQSAARHAEGADTNSLDAAAGAMEASVRAGSVVDFLKADKLLDEVMAAMADNPFAARGAAPLQTHSRRLWFRYQSDSGLAQSVEHHVGLIRSILRGDEEMAGREARRLMDMLRNLAIAAARR